MDEYKYVGSFLGHELLQVHRIMWHVTAGLQVPKERRIFYGRLFNHDIFGMSIQIKANKWRVIIVLIY